MTGLVVGTTGVSYFQFNSRRVARKITFSCSNLLRSVTIWSANKDRFAVVFCLVVIFLFSIINHVIASPSLSWQLYYQSARVIYSQLDHTQRTTISLILLLILLIHLNILQCFRFNSD